MSPVYGYDTDLANRLRQWLSPIGVQVVEIDGWQSRGRTYATFNPYGSVNHHTAGGPGLAPSLGICINGRAGLPGPLCQVHQQRNDVVNVVAAGVANHAGRGSWRGQSGNASMFGLEIEHRGYDDEPFPERRLDIACRVHAAFLSGLGNPDPGMLCQHFEWSAEGKIDFVRTLLPGGPNGFRDRVAALLGGTAPAPVPPPVVPAPRPPSGGGNGRIAMPLTQQGDSGRNVRIVQAICGSAIDGQFGPNTKSAVQAMQRVLGASPDGIVGDNTWTRFLQYRLNLLYGANHPSIDGDYGPETTAYTRWFQASHGLAADGIAGYDTFGALTGQ